MNLFQFGIPEIKHQLKILLYIYVKWSNNMKSLISQQGEVDIVFLEPQFTLIIFARCVMVS